MAAILAAANAAPALAQSESPAVEAAVNQQYEDRLGELFRWFHQNPELSFLETETAARMAAELRAAGLEVTEGVGGTGVVGMVRNGEGPLILLRADMDGLPVEERSGLEYASQARQEDRDGEEYPVMHACGHDVHITSMVGTARQLMAMRDQWSGTLMFIVQPAEERIGGARAMLDDGLYDRFGTPDYALAFHVSADDPTGTVLGAPGIYASSSDSVNIHVPGVGAHGAAPHQGRDPIYIASQIVVGLQSIVSRETNPLTPAVVTVGAFNAGTKHNIIGEGADLQLTVRANDEETRAATLAAIERIATNTGRAHGLAEDNLPTMEVVEGTPVTWNDPALAERLNATMIDSFGDGVFRPYAQDSMGAEDFAYFVAEEYGVPGYYFSVGGTPPEDLAAAENGGPPVAGHHSPLFKIAPRESITLGARAMIAAVLELAPAS